MEKSFEREVLDRLIKIETKLDEQDYKTIKKVLDDAENRSISNEKRLDKIEDNTKWLWRTIAGILVGGAIAFIFKI